MNKDIKSHVMLLIAIFLIITAIIFFVKEDNKLRKYCNNENEKVIGKDDHYVYCLISVEKFSETKGKYIERTYRRVER